MSNIAEKIIQDTVKESYHEVLDGPIKGIDDTCKYIADAVFVALAMDEPRMKAVIGLDLLETIKASWTTSVGLFLQNRKDFLYFLDGAIIEARRQVDALSESH